MNAAALEAALHRVLVPIDRSAASIEQAFLHAGESMSRGLEAFGQLGADLDTLLADFQAGGMADVSAQLKPLSEQLTGISRSLPEDARALASLVASNQTIADHLTRLRDNILTMTVIARSARIESVSIDEALGFDTFTAEMNELTRTVREVVGSCVLDHSRLCHKLRNVATAQAALDRDFRQKLLSLAGELNEALVEIADRQRSGLGLMEEVAARSGRISQATAMAMVSLQSGDATRQRLEHVSAAVNFALDLTRGRDCGGAQIEEPARPATIALLCRLQHAQLHDLVQTFTQDVDTIDEALGRLGEDTDEQAASGLKIYGADTGSDSFLAAFRARLATAIDFVRTCELARAEVESATADVRTGLTGLNGTIETLGTTTEHLVMICLNAGLKAARLGSEGRSLTVIADELKRLAGAISSRSADLVSIFAEVQDASHRLDRQDDYPRDVKAGQAILTIVGALEEGDARMSRFLGALTQKARHFDAQLSTARNQFRSAVSMNADLLGAAATLEALGTSAPADGSQGGAAERVDALLSALYTMQSERDAHATVLGRTADLAVAPQSWHPHGHSPAGESPLAEAG